jgi:Mg-dependent DNase
MVGVGPSLEWSSRAQEVAQTVPMDNLLVETDSPYIGDKPTDVLSVCNLLRSIKGGSAVDGVPFLDRLARNASEFFSRDL